MRTLAVIFVLSLLSVSASGEDLEDLAMDGYGVAARTAVNGEFNGCDFDRAIELQNGLVFKCSEYKYHYAYMPTVLILKSVRDDSVKVVIDRESFNGTLYRR